jgi:formate hydrogenlyase subunit 3/multisubunit Na+/H+ antiporter MnhD subunit
MLLFFLTYIFLISAVGAVAVGLGKYKALFHYFAATLISLLSLGALFYLLWNFLSAGEEVRLITLPWAVPWAQFSVGMDSLSLFFAIPLLILTVACSIYGAQYFKEHTSGILHWFKYAMLVAGMMMVLFARNGILFITAWEIMSFASFLLVITDADKASVRRAGWIYLITAHIGTAFLFITFFLLAAPVNSFEFSAFATANYSATQLNLIFISGLIAFGMKAGFIPFHLWLPLAHPAAPSHVSGLMSGIMIKMGIYGIFQLLLFSPLYHIWWGVLLIVLGVISGIGGVMFANGQHDIKRMLAYCSVENIGIILLGMGIGVLGMACEQPVVAVLGFAGALLHIVNHSIFKALLFLGAGAVIRQTGTGNINDLGGLIKKMPWTAAMFLLGSLAITGLPFFNGFISEMFIYAAAITGTVNGTGTLLPMMTALTVVTLAVIGALAVACFTKTFGLVFLGLARDKKIGNGSGIPSFMLTGMLFLALFIVFIGLCSLAVVPFIAEPVKQLVGSDFCIVMTPLLELSENLTISLALACALILVLIAIRFLLLRRHEVLDVETWGCGYSNPDPSMQYSASSFAEPLTDTFNILLDVKKSEPLNQELFSTEKWTFSSKVNDWILNNISIPAVKFIDRLLGLLRWIQCGKTGVYVVYIIAVLFGLIIWMFTIWKS